MVMVTVFAPLFVLLLHVLDDLWLLRQHSVDALEDLEAWAVDGKFILRVAVLCLVVVFFSGGLPTLAGGVLGAFGALGEPGVLAQAVLEAALKGASDARGQGVGVLRGTAGARIFLFFLDSGGRILVIGSILLALA